MALFWSRVFRARNGWGTFVAGMLFSFPAVSSTPSEVSALLLRQTEAFSDASQAGDARTLDRLLDPGVVFVNETGEVATKQDVVGSATPTTGGVGVKMTVTDWHCSVHGDVAVASFIDNQVVAGRPFHTQFRSVETWLKQGAAWRMIGSETLTLPIDPPAMALSGDAVGDYVGVYQDRSGIRITFTRSGNTLEASANGGPSSAQQAEGRDVFFTAGHGDVRKVFERDAGNKVIGLLYIHDGHDLFFRKA